MGVAEEQGTSLAVGGSTRWFRRQIKALGGRRRDLLRQQRAWGGQVLRNGPCVRSDLTTHRAGALHGPLGRKGCAPSIQNRTPGRKQGQAGTR